MESNDLLSEVSSLKNAIFRQLTGVLSPEELEDLFKLKTSRIVDRICIDAILAGHTVGKHVRHFNVFPYQWRGSSKEDVSDELVKRGYNVEYDGDILCVQW